MVTRDFRKEGYVSAWLGHFESNSTLQAYIRLNYETDPPSSPFQEDFNLGRYRPEYREAQWFAQAAVVPLDILRGASYSRSFFDAFSDRFERSKAIEPNTIILLYGFQYIGPEIDLLKKEGISITFIGSFKYDRAAGDVG